MATPRQYPWKRFWCPREGSFSLDNQGFLLDPAQVPSYFSGVVPFKDIATSPCLVLLGEPGIGKSRAMQDEKEAIEADLFERGESLLWLDLKGIGDENRLLRKSFESEKLTAWTNGGQILHLFLDSLDECRLRVPHVAAILMEQLREIRQHINRLRLRIACRTAEWPSQLEDGLPELWGSENVGTFELVPLRRCDVHLAAEIEEVNPATFLAEIEDKDAQPLAIKPVTLRFLLNVYRRDGRFPAQQATLYREGCRLLAAESSQSRNDSGQRGNLGSAQRLAVAARIAAVSMFCKRTAVYVGNDHRAVSPDDVRIEELCGETESADGVTFSVGENEIREVLDTGLFSSRGPYRLGFAHQTYAEFLAARYLIDRGLEARQILSLIRHAEHSGGAVVPQLAETAAWLAEMHSEVFQEVLRRDPKILLRSDVSQATHQDRETLVSSLLELFQAQELQDEWDIRESYRRLQHPALAQQLAPYIRLGREAWLVRRVAIDIAESCNLVDLQNLLLEVALDAQDFQPTRVEAAKAIARIGTKEVRQQLLPLALGVAEDTDDELKGTALQALWPEFMSAQELFEALTPIREDRLLGTYRDFLERHLLRCLPDSDLPEALTWVLGQPRRHRLRSPLHSLSDEILVRAFQSADEPKIRQHLTDTLLARATRLDRLRDPEVIARAETLLPDSVRRQIVEEVMGHETDFSLKRRCLVFDRPRLAKPEDLDWVLGRLYESRSEGAAGEWAQLAFSIFYLEHPGHPDRILTESIHNPTLADAFKGYLGSIDLSSKEAAELRANFELVSDPSEQQAGERVSIPSPAERIESCLLEFERGNFDTWWKLVREMTFEATSPYYGSELEPLPTKLPGWRNAGQDTRRRILRAAYTYVLQWEPTPKKWFGKNFILTSDFIGYKALCLLASEDATVVNDLPPEIWERWIPIILGCPLSTPSEADAVVHRAVVSRAYHSSPGPFLSFLNQVINLQNRERDHLDILRRLDNCWDEHLIAALCKKAKQPSLKAGSLQHLLEELFRRGSKDAEEYARSLIRVPITQEPKRRARARAAALVLLGHASDAGWKEIKPALDADPKWGREVFEGLAHSHHERAGNIARRLQEAEVADLYLWLAQEYPQHEDPDLGADGWIGPREGTAFFRDGLLNHLRDRGTPAASRELERIVQSIPDVSHLKFFLLTARQNTLRQTWIPLSPSAFLQFSRHAGTRLVRNANQLLGIVLESLQKLQSRLQGKPPMAPYLWDGKRPKDEEALSDWIKVHLDQELGAAGIVALREVQVERGEETDLHITAQVPGFEPNTWEPVDIIIEVKGSWHPKVRTAMKDQLVETYLKNNTCRHGIYLVGWYRCEAWDPSDSRARAHKRWTWEAAQEELAEQARSLSQEGRTVRALLLDVRLRDKGATTSS